MDIIGDRRFVEIPGEKLHELPPLLVRGAPKVKCMDKIMSMAHEIVQTEELLADSAFDDINSEIEIERRKMDLAMNLVDQYLEFIHHWQWGDGILEWVRQCETTFQFSMELRPVLRPDVWPHASRCSFVTLLDDKAVRPEHVDLQRAVGMRLTFRQPPPIGCFSNQFLFYLKHTVGNTAYQTWAHMAPDPISSLPPERFTFQVVNM